MPKLRFPLRPNDKNSSLEQSAGEETFPWGFHGDLDPGGGQYSLDTHAVLLTQGICYSGGGGAGAPAGPRLKFGLGI